MIDKICLWKHNGNMEYPGWETSCGEEFCFIEEGPEENNYTHCPNCGGRLHIEGGN